MFNHNSENHVISTTEKTFNKTQGTWSEPLEDRWGTRASGDGRPNYGVTAPHREREHMGDDNYDKGPERTQDVAAKAAKVQKILDSRGADYETHVFPRGTYYAQNANVAVTYHKPTGAIASSMIFHNDGHVNTWARHPDHSSAASLATGLAAHNHLKSIGNVSGVLHAEMTTPESARVLKMMDPFNTSLAQRHEIDSYDDESTMGMLTSPTRNQNTPATLSEVASKPTTEDIARLSDMTGRHPMNFLALSSHENDRQEASRAGYGAQEGSKLDPTVLRFVREREELSPLPAPSVKPGQKRDNQSQGDLRTLEQRAARRLVDNQVPVSIHNAGVPGENGVIEVRRENGIHGRVQRENDVEVREWTRRRDGRRMGERDSSVADKPENLQDAGMYVHKEPYQPRTTEERLDQDPLARARIIRGKAFYGEREVGKNE
jgi:hypothetical protein